MHSFLVWQRKRAIHRGGMPRREIRRIKQYAEASSSKLLPEVLISPDFIDQEVKTAEHLDPDSKTDLERNYFTIAVAAARRLFLTDSRFWRVTSTIFISDLLFIVSMNWVSFFPIVAI